MNFPEEDGVEFSTKEEGGEGSDERDRSPKNISCLVLLSLDVILYIDDILFSATAQTAMSLHSVSEGNV